MHSANVHGKRGEEHVKLVLIGGVNVGKSSLAFYMHKGERATKVAPTIGGAFNLIVREGYRLNLWDSCGACKYGAIVPMYVRGAQVIMCVFDLTDGSTLDRVEKDREKYMEEIVGADKAIWVLVANKADLEPYMPAECAQQKSRAEKLSAQWNVKYLIVSAETGAGVKELLDYIVKELDGVRKRALENPALVEIEDLNIVQLNSSWSTNGDFMSKIPFPLRSSCCQ